MIAELKAVKAVVAEAIGAEVLIGDATGHLPPFGVVWAPPGRRDDDEAYSGPVGEFAARIGVTLTAADTEIALEMAEATIQALTPLRRPARLDVEGRVVWLTFFEARPVAIDREVTHHNRHPAYVAVLFTLRSHPAGETPWP